MKENYYDIIKYSSIAVITVCLIINIISIISIFNLKQTNISLTNKLEILSKNYEEKLEYYNYLVNNYDEINDVFLREEKDLIKNNETIVNF